MKNESYCIIPNHTNLSKVKVKMPVSILILSQHFECQRSYFSKFSTQTNCAELHQK